MAALPAKVQVKKQAVSRNERADDIARLKVELSLPSLEYIDISAQMELSRALQRWPLLVDLTTSGEPTQDLPAHQPIRKNRFGAQS
ncbi:MULTISPECIES: cellulose biosynthesis protein BcsR [Pseudomonas]|jgi:hypothetical protein|uniref:Cellulose biosynthesis protein BcsR n=1 Tax=Pseudomonas folii TaxID=2762593 RepID=A0ABR7AYN6_9PSED|nr:MULTISPECIES: cellulose biosynthesis protein BcsR [Pseudomonas]MBC3950043.1 hypothetical protein [Pseudomonas folii]